MKTTKERAIALWLAVLWVFGFGAAASVQAADNEKEQIKATLTAMWSSLESGDVESYGQYIHPEFTQFGENDLYLNQGKDLEIRSIDDWVSRSSDVHTEMHQPVVTVRGDVAWIVYYWTDSGKSGGKRFTSRGKSTRIFVKEDGRWLCIHGHYTAVP